MAVSGIPTLQSWRYQVGLASDDQSWWERLAGTLGWGVGEIVANPSSAAEASVLRSTVGTTTTTPYTASESPMASYMLPGWQPSTTSTATTSTTTGSASTSSYSGAYPGGYQQAIAQASPISNAVTQQTGTGQTGTEQTTTSSSGAGGGGTTGGSPTSQPVRGLDQLPQGSEVWMDRATGRVYLVYFDPIYRTPLAWHIEDPATFARLFGTDVDPYFYDGYQREFGPGEFAASGALPMGESRELAQIEGDPFDYLMSIFEVESQVKPWLKDPEILALTSAAILEGRQLSDAELQTTNWWRTHTAEQRAWMSLSASDPASAAAALNDNYAAVRAALISAGVNNPTDDLIRTIATKWTQGDWTDSYTQEQIRLVADPMRPGTRDDALVTMLTGLDTTRGREDEVRSELYRWLGPNFAASWNDQQIADWAGKLRNDPDAGLQLTEELQRQRLALFPGYDQNLTYNDIAAPWRNIWSSSWGQMPDETDPLFVRIVNMNDRVAADQLLRREGLARGNGQVTQDALSGLLSATGSVRPSNAAVM